MQLPLTKALHTTRVIYRLARMVAERGKPSTEYGQPRTSYPPEAAAYVFRCVLAILGNEPPTSGALMADCLAACERALVEVKAERVILERERTERAAA